MTLGPLELLAVVLVPFLLGAALLRAQGLGPRDDPLGWGAWSWMEGSLGLGVFLSGWLWLSLPLRGAWLAACLLALAAVLLAAGRRAPRAPATSGDERFPRWERALFATVLAVVLAIALDRVLFASNNAIVEKDEAHIWAAKAKAIFAAGEFGASFQAIVDSPTVFSHLDYPPLNSLLQVWVFSQAGEIVHVENRLPVQLFGVALVLAVASAARFRARPLVAAAFVGACGLVGSTRLCLEYAFADTMVAFGLLVAWDAWQRWERTGEARWLRVLAGAAALLVWSKNEGLTLVLALVLGIASAGALGRARLPGPGRRARFLLVALPAALSALYLVWFNGHFGLENDLLVGSAAARGERIGLLPRFITGLERTGTIARHFGGLLLDWRSGFLPLAAAVCALLFPSAAWARGRMAMTVGLALSFLTYFAAYMVTHWEVQRHLDTSAHRLLGHLTPAAGLWLLGFATDALPWTRAGAPGARGRVSGDTSPRTGP